MSLGKTHEMRKFMRKKHIIPVCLVLIIIVIFVVAVIIQSESDSRYLLTANQKQAIKKAKMANEDLSDADIDSFTIGQGKYLLDQYFKEHNLNYRIGTKEYIDFLASIMENSETYKDPEFTIIDAYGSVYVTKNQEKEPLFFRFHLDSVTLDKTIKEIRVENTK